VEVLRDDEVTPQGARRHLDFLREDRYDDQYIEGISWELEGRELRVTTTIGQGLNVVDDDEVREAVRQVAVNELADTARVRVVRGGRKRLRAVLPATATVGVQLLEPLGTRSSELGTVTSGKDWIANEFYEVRFRKGRLTITDKRTGFVLKGANTFVDEGDRGDEYNADILPDAVVKPFHMDSRPVVQQRSMAAQLGYGLLLNLPGALALGRIKRKKSKDEFLNAFTWIRLWAGTPESTSMSQLEMTPKTTASARSSPSRSR
jgi:hypothetical protein